MTTTLEFEGVVETWAMPEDDWHALTARIGDVDVVAAVAAAALDLNDPVTAAVTIDTEAPLTGQLEVSRGYAVDGCNSCYEGAEFAVGDTSILAVLDKHDGQHVTLTVTLAAHVPEPEPIVPVEWAHHINFDGTRYAPLDVLELPKSEAQRLALAGTITKESATAAGLRWPW